MRFFILLGFLTVLATSVQADDFAPLSILVKRQDSLLNRIEPYVERVDLPKLKFLKQSNRALLETILSQGATNMVTIQQLQQLVIAYRFSKDIFDAIRTERTTEAIDSLQATAREISDRSGFDQSPYTKITYGVFQQLRNKILTLLELSIAPEFAAKLRELQPHIGRVMAAASQGDHRLTIEEGSKCLQKITALYPEFNQVSVSNVAFDAVLEIQGIAEFYAAFIRSGDSVQSAAQKASAQ